MGARFNDSAHCFADIDPEHFFGFKCGFHCLGDEVVVMVKGVEVCCRGDLAINCICIGERVQGRHYASVRESRRSFYGSSGERGFCFVECSQYDQLTSVCQQVIQALHSRVDSLCFMTV